MPKDRKTGSGTGGVTPVRAMAALILLSGCVGGGDVASRSSLRADATAATAEAPAKAGSAIITELQARKSILPPGGVYAKVAASVLEADAGTSAAELRIARLKSEARAKNWLPKLGPSVSLTALNGLAAGMLLEQALFDHGRRKAEREYAAADVEVAAVTLSTDINQRVYEGLVHYVTAEKARAQAAVASRAVERIGGFANVMRQRVDGDRDAETSAMAELTAMAASPLTDLRGLDALPVAAAKDEPLSVTKARGIGARDIAESRAARAGLMPGLSANTNIGTGGINPGLSLDGAGLLGWGTKEELAALDATQDVVNRRTNEAAESADRRIVALERQIDSLQNRQTQGAEVLRQTEGNLELFVEQYKLGRRSLLELVGQYDSYARLERDQTALRYEIALLELEIARDRGVLVDGARM